jgi:TRAP-type C4-dicarboxylate transport system permease small subunit
MGGTTFLNLPVWIPELIMPVAFGLMTLRFVMEMIECGIRSAECGKRSE